MHKQTKQMNFLSQPVTKTQSKFISENSEHNVDCRIRVESPLRQIGNLKLVCSPRVAKNKSRTRKISRLLTSKSLSKLMTRSLSLAIKQNESKVPDDKQNVNRMGTKMRSFPTTRRANMRICDDDDYITVKTSPCSGESSSEGRESYGERTHRQITEIDQNIASPSGHGLGSDSMIVLSNGQPSSSILRQSELSPIIGSQQSGGSSHSGGRSISPCVEHVGGQILDSSPGPVHDHYPVMSSTRVVLSSSTDMSTSGYVSSGLYSTISTSDQKPVKKQAPARCKRNSPRSSRLQSISKKKGQNMDEDENEYFKQANPKATCNKKSSSPRNVQSNKTKTFKPFRSTHLVLRDVKNSLALVSKQNIINLKIISELN